MAFATPRGLRGDSAAILSVPCFAAFLAESRSPRGVLAESSRSPRGVLAERHAIQMVEEAVFCDISGRSAPECARSARRELDMMTPARMAPPKYKVRLNFRPRDACRRHNVSKMPSVASES